ncbi:MAG TPA: lytic murein transglycosylase, partial [Thermoanaerobaculia bacterium]
MRSKFASIFAAFAGFMAITAIAAALAGAEPVSENSAVAPSATTTTAVPSLAAPACANGIDDDGDGLVDTEDPDCESPADTTEIPPATPAEASEGEEVAAPAPAPSPEKNPQGGVEHGTEIGSPTTTGSADHQGGATRNDELAAPSANNNGGLTAPSATGGGSQPLPEGSNGGSPFTEGGAPTTANPTTTIAPFGPAPIGVPNFVIDSFEIPPFLLPIYQACGAEYGIPWEVLASINKIETAFGTNTNVSSAGAVGWMQFLPSSWEQFGLDANGDGKKDPYNPVDAICAAAHYLKLAGGNKDLYQAIFAYNHADWYVQEVLLYARAYGRLPSDLVGSLTGLTEGAHFPIAADARYADDVAARAALKNGESPEYGNAAEVISSSPTPRGINIFSKEGAPVVAVNDGVVRKLGHSAKLGNFLVLEDTYGNRYTYAELGKFVRNHRLVVMPSGKEKRVPVESQDLRPRLRAYPGRSGNSAAADKLEAALAASGEGAIQV